MLKRVIIYLFVFNYDINFPCNIQMKSEHRVYWISLYILYNTKRRELSLVFMVKHTVSAKM